MPRGQTAQLLAALPYFIAREPDVICLQYGYNDVALDGLNAAGIIANFDTAISRNLAVSDPTAVSKIADFAKATPSAKSDIGTGLGQAAKICVPTQFTQAQALQQAVIALNDPLVLTAFLAVTGDIATTATGGGAGGGGGGPGGAGINSSVASSGAGGSFARSTATGTTVNGTFSISPGSGASVTTTNAITQAAAAVSP